jgi:hypothetical protein
MRERKEIENAWDIAQVSAMNDIERITMHQNITKEVLLDIRDQNQEIIKLLTPHHDE